MGFLEKIGQVFLDAAAERLEIEIREALEKPQKSRKKSKRSPQQQQRQPRQLNEIPVAPGLSYIPPPKKP